MKQILIVLLLLTSQASAYWMYENQGDDDALGVRPGGRLLVEEVPEGFLYQSNYKTYGPGYVVDWEESHLYHWANGLTGITSTRSFEQEGREKVTNTTWVSFDLPIQIKSNFEKWIVETHAWQEDADGEVFSSGSETKRVTHLVSENGGVHTWTHSDVVHFVWGAWSNREIRGGAHFVLVASGNGDFDADGVPDEDDSDVDGDGVENTEDGDWDNDGVSNENENKAGTDPNDPRSTPDDLDGDGIPDSQDEDIDGDGIANSDEKPEDVYRNPEMKNNSGTKFTDLDGDGVPDSVRAASTSESRGSPPVGGLFVLLLLLSIVRKKSV